MRRESFFATMSLSFMKPMRKRGKEGDKVSRLNKVGSYFYILSVRLKFGFIMGNRNQGPFLVWVLEPKCFFPKPIFFFSNFFKFSHVFLLLKGIYRF